MQLKVQDSSRAMTFGETLFMWTSKKRDDVFVTGYGRIHLL